MARNMPESEDDFIQMQQEAIRRVRQMQDRARRTLENAGMQIEQDGGPLPAAGEEPASHAPNPAPAPPVAGRDPRRLPPEHPQGHSFSPGRADPIKLPVFNLSIDSDQLLLILLIYLLIKDGADQWLILSLAYVLLT